MTKLTIQGLEFEVEAPYKEGDVIDANEASALNQTFVENIRNNFAATIKAAKAEICKTNGWVTKDGDKEVPDLERVSNDALDMDEINASFVKYVESYEFGTRRVGGTRAPADPVEREARRLAWEKVKELLKAKGYSVNKIEAETKDRLVGQALENYPEIRETARTLVAAAKDIDLGDLQI